MTLSAIFFDLDGTLTDPKPGITACVQHALDRLGHIVPSADQLEWMIGPPLQESFARLLISVDMVDEAVALYRERFAEIGLFENRVYDGIPAILSMAQRRETPLYVASSKPKLYVDRILSHFDLMPYFTDSFGSELDGTRAYKSELLRHALKETSVAPENAVMIGDRKHDILGARANGMDSIGVAYGYGDVAELTEAGAGFVAHDIASLEARLKDLLP